MAKFLRRLQKIGSTMLVSLPKEWIDSHGLDKGSQVEVETGHDTITISTGMRVRPARELTISYPLPKEENIVADITGAYLLGFGLIQVNSQDSIPAEDREKIRDSMRRLVGMEIIEEDASHIQVQFLLDATTLNPQKILRRMSSIALGMYNETVAGLVSNDLSNLQTMPKRDVEVNRQYFLLVRLIRSALVDRRLSSAFNLGNIDVLDYRIAANLLENAGDSIVELSRTISNTTLSKAHSEAVLEVARTFGRVGGKSVEAFTGPDRLLAIEAISMHREFSERLQRVRTGRDGGGRLPLELLDIVYMLERIAQSWADMADLVTPLYR